MSHTIELQGCSPDPLMAYLKALGIFRLVTEQQDENARAWWERDRDTLRLDSNLAREELVNFLLEEYRPSPIVSPWNGGSGFYRKDNRKAMDAILQLESPRFQLWSQVISLCNEILAQPEASAKDGKEWILSQCRARMPDEALPWLDAAYVLTGLGAKCPPLLGSGGNDGRLEFSNNFMQNIVSALNLENKKDGAATARSQAEAALFAEASPKLIKNRTSGFFNPASAGGDNATAGFRGDSLTNPWDYVLMLEGTLLFAGAAARRLSASAIPKAIFPFTTDATAAGYGTAADSEYGESARAEFWAPLWDRPATLRELSHLIAEGRAQLGRQQAHHGAGFARAVAGLGTERGITQFQRYGLLERHGRNYLATPIGRFHTGETKDGTQRADMLFELDPWLDRLRHAAGRRDAPAGTGVALRKIDQAIIDFCQSPNAHELQNVLIATGRAERWLSASSLRHGKYPIRPLTLSWQWLTAADDDTTEFRTEFRLSRAISSILPEAKDGKPAVGPIRENLEPVDAKQGAAEWTKGNSSPSFVWTAEDTRSNMLATLERRCLEGRMKELEYPPLNSRRRAQLAYIVKFINGEVDLQRIADLTLPLSFIRHRPLRQPTPKPSGTGQAAPADLSATYAAMKLTLLPGKLNSPRHGANDLRISTEPAMLTMLRAGRINDAYRLAHRRLRSSGLRPLAETAGIPDHSEKGKRLAAALLFPVSGDDYAALAERALRETANPQ